MESNFKVPLTKVLKVENHPNADRLDVVTVFGFQVIAGKGQYQIGDDVVYAPIDSILPDGLESILFPPDSKIKLTKGRIRQIKIRGLASQGMLINPSSLIPILGADRVKRMGTYDAEEDLADELGIQKYEPPVKGPSHTIGKGPRNRTYENKLFHKYNGLTALKWVPDIFNGKNVVIQEKLHGTNARAGIVPFEANNLWKKFLKFIGLASEYENCYGSNNVEISAKVMRKTGYYSEDIYGKVFKKMDVFSKLKPGEIVYGEIIGPELQKNYDYGLKEHKFVLFDVKELQPDGKYKWMLPCEVRIFAQLRGFEMVPELYEGPYDKDKAYALTFGPSVYCSKQKVREGIVIKQMEDYDNCGNKQAYKWVSEDYLADKSNTDNH